MTESKICTCPSGDGSLRWPCPAHPAVDQAGGDRWDALQSIMEWTAAENIPDDRKLCLIRNAARAALAQPSPAPELERPEVAEVAFVLRNIGAMDAEDIDGDNVDLRFEDAEGRDTGCDVSIVEYAEKAADLFEQHDRIVGALRAKADQLREALEWRKENQAGQRELLRSVTAERDAALARVAELEALMQMNFGELHTARNLLSRLSVSGVNVDAILGGQLQDLVIVPADATLEMVEALKRSLTVTNRGTLLNAGHALNASIAASPFAKKAPEPVMCPRCEGEGTLRTGIDESPSTICKRCDGVGTIAAAPGKEGV
ncbi:hypothetical protein VUS58_09840 [Pseudomonas aeruginosa]|uniref:hypothetical protein n=1 Tax=Pseudomonas aeruginosa TaxID=287 RepID=UPI003006565F